MYETFISSLANISGESTTVESPWNSDRADRILAWDRTSYGCCVLCWGRLDAILFFSPSLFPHSLLSIYLFGNLLLVRLILLRLTLPPFVSPFLVSFFLYAACTSRLCPSPRLFPPSLPSSSSRARTRRAFRKRLSPTYTRAGVCVASARICVGLYCVRWKARRGNRWMRIYVSRIIRVHV